MREWIETDSAGFCEQAVPALRHTKESPAYRHLLWLICASKILARILCDPALLSEDEAASLAEKLRKIDPTVEMNLVKEIFGVDGMGGISLVEPAYGLRFLAVFSNKINSVHLLPVVGRLIRHPNATIRSKAATMLGKMSRHHDWLEQTRHETDDRVRANALEALWEPGLPERLRARLWEGVNDPSNRVVGNALLGLYRQGEPGCIPLIISLTRHPEEKFRATAAWLIGETGDDRFRDYLLPLLEESSALVLRNAMQAMQKLDVRAAFSGIERLQLVMFSNERGAMPRNPSVASQPETSVHDSSLCTSRILRVTAVSQHGTPVSELVPTDFRIARDAHQVEHYTVHQEVPPETMSIAFALPAADASGARLSHKWRAFLAQFFKQKRHQDYWGFLEYTHLGSNAMRTDQTYAPVRDIPASSSAAPSSRPISPAEKAAFIRNFVELDDFLAARMQSSRSHQLTTVLDLLLAPPPFLRTGAQPPKGALHAIIVESPGSRDVPRERLEAVKSAALSRGFTIHLVSPNSASALAELSIATGGSFLICQEDVESWQRYLTILYASFFSTYKLEFELGPHQAEETRIRISVRKGPLFGEFRTVCMPDNVCVPV